MGMTEANAEGCILADEMGLGKTLQTIALIHTLLSQLPPPRQLNKEAEGRSRTVAVDEQRLSVRLCALTEMQSC